MDNALARKLLGSKSQVPEEIPIYRDQTAAFRRKFGRDMGPDDPFFFDPDADTPRFRSPSDADYAIDWIARLMVEAHVDPAAIYAFKRTGGLIPTASLSLLPHELVEWNAAIYEYHEKLVGGRTQ